MRESVIMYISTYSAILKRISSIEQREAVFEAIFNYAFYDEPIQEFDNPVADAIMDMVKPLIDNNNKNYVNGCKGGRPKKGETDTKKPPDKTTGKNHRIKPPDEPPEKGNVNENENVNENVNGDSHLHFTKESDAHSPSAGAGGAHTFTFAEVQQCAEENEIDISDAGITAFYKWMEKYNWTIKGQKVTKLKNALSGYANKHPEYSLDPKGADIEDEIYKIAHYYISQELFNANSGKHHRLIGEYCPKEAFTQKQSHEPPALLVV